jgi:hypothetical protein
MTTMKKTPGPERAYKAWYKEMLAALKERWHVGLNWTECEALCGELTSLRARIQEERGIKAPQKFCRNCQTYHEMKHYDVSVRALLFALKKVGAVGESEMASLDKAWQKELRGRKRRMAPGGGGQDRGMGGACATA